MKSTRVLVGAGVISFLLFLISNIPASLITSRLEAGMPGQVRTGGIEGTIWDGYIRSIDVTGWQLRDTRWNLNPAALLIGRLSANVETRTAGGEISGDLSISLGGDLSLSDLEAAGPFTPLATRFKLPISGGRYEVRIAALQIVDDWPTRLVGVGKLTGLPLTIVGTSPDVTGNYTISFDHESIAALVPFDGSIVDEGGPIELAGKVELTPPNAFEFKAKLRARPGAPSTLTQAMQLMGQADAQGRYEFSLAGTL